MRVRRFPLFFAALLALPGLAVAADDADLLAAINHYRSDVQQCAQQSGGELPPLNADKRLVLPVEGGDLEQALARAGYPLVNVRSINLSGPRDAAAAMQALQQSFCQILLDPQFIDIGISQVGRDWRIVLGRPLLAARLGDWQVEGERLLALINEARGQARRCGSQAFEATQALSWNATLGTAAQRHSRAMANGNFFSHRDADGRIPSDRVELEGYSASRVGENIAAALDTPRKVVDAWLASPGHCANLMSPQFSELGVAYAVDPNSDAGIYWTALFAAP